MKSLDQVEPRIPISALPFTVSAGGHYYVTRNLATTGDGITVNADDVVIDLGGFALSGDGGSGDIGISVTGRDRVTIRHGTIRSFSGGVILNAGCSDCLLEDLAVRNCSNTGVSASITTTLVVTRSVFRNLTCTGNGTHGLSVSTNATGTLGQNVIERCTFIGNTAAGLALSATGNLVLGCRASGNSPNYEISPGNRAGAIVAPSVNASLISGSTGGPGSGTSDPFANLSF